MAGLLGDVFSTIDSYKRRGAALAQGLMTDPLEVARQHIANLNNAAGQNLTTLGNLYKDDQGKTTLDPSQWSAQSKAAHDDLTDQMTGAMMGATVWHGTPHVFNKLDPSKIGTGEGNQSYGHGLYLAEAPEVAQGYASALSDVSQQTPIGRAARALQDANGDPLLARKNLYNEWTNATSQPMSDAAYSAIDALNSGKVKAPNVYKVDLPDEHIANMLNWDEPMSAQTPFVQDAMQRAGGQFDPSQTGADAWKRMWLDTRVAAAQAQDRAALQGARATTSQVMSDAGIPGIKYLDQFSRYGDDQRTRNFVVFPGNTGILNILDRNGIPLNQGLAGAQSPLLDYGQ